MTRLVSTLIAVAILAAAPAFSGEIYGTIVEGGKSVGEGIAVEAKCGDKGYPAVKTDKVGAYHLAVAEKGKCTVTVHHKGQAASIEVASYDDGVQVDLVLELKDGKYALRRK